MMSILYLIILVYVCGIVYGSKGNPNPAMLKGKTAKMRVMLSHSLVREQKGYRKSYVPDFASVFDQQSKLSSHDNCDDTMNGAQVFVRKYGAGLWNLLQCLPYDDIAVHLHTAVSEGGIEAENERHALDKWVATKVFGTGMGDPLLLNSVRNILPQFKKLKAQQLQFGYRIIDEDIGVIERSMVNGVPSFKKRFTGIPAEPQIQLSEHLADGTVQNIIKVLKDPENLHRIRNREEVQDILSLNRHVLNFTRNLIAHNVSKLLICTDGSASFNDAGCVLAAGGVAVTAVQADSQGVDQPVVDAGNNNVSLYVRVSDMECMTTTPFDAELTSGLAGLVLSKLILKQHHKHIVPAASGPMQASLTMELCSDSRSYCRALRTDLTEDLTARNEHNRLLVWQLASGLLSSMVTGSNSTTTGMDSAAVQGGVSAVWAAGHPERSDANPDSWTVRQRGLWAADYLAKSRTSGAGADIGIMKEVAVVPHVDLSAALEIPALDVIRLSRALLSY